MVLVVFYLKAYKRPEKTNLFLFYNFRFF
jgi:hypothetical protein